MWPYFTDYRQEVMECVAASMASQTANSLFHGQKRTASECYEFLKDSFESAIIAFTEAVNREWDAEHKRLVVAQPSLN